jgi:predicted RNA-binding protein with PIN domain
MLYLFDGSNIFHAGRFRDQRELVDRLASFVAVQGARGVVVFDGVGEPAVHGSLEVRYAPHADDVVERLAADHRRDERVFVVSSDRAIARTSGQDVAHISSRRFVTELERALAEAPPREPHDRSQVGDALDEETRKRLEEWRRRR